MEMRKLRNRALLKVILFVVRVQYACRRHKCRRSPPPDSTTSRPNSSSPKRKSRRSSPRNSLQVSDCFIRNTNKTKEKYLSWTHLNEEFELGKMKFSDAPLMSGNRSISCTVGPANRQHCRKVSCPEPPTVVLWNEENDNPTFMRFTHMSKPYTFLAYGINDSSSSAAAASSTVDGQNRCQGKNLMVSCNSVMGNPKKFGRRLIRQGSSTDLRTNDDGLSMCVNDMRKNLKPPMIRTLTADSSDIRLRCVSDENVAQTLQNQAPNHNVRSPRSLQKFAKRKSSADLLDGNVLDWDMAKISTSAGLTKIEKKRLEKLKSNMKHFLELFTAVEQDDIGKVRIMLQYNEIDINGTNMDDLTLLDVAVMLNHNEVALLLLQYGAQENLKLSLPENRMKHIHSLLESAQNRLGDLNVQANDSSCSKTIEKQISTAESRLHVFKKMRNNFENSGVPRPPRNVILRITSPTSLMVSFEPPEQLTSVVTRYKVEWSSTKDFNSVKGTTFIKDLRRLDVHIPNLHTGRIYYVRVSAGNFKGFGQAIFGEPEFAIPSSWREVDGKEQKSNRLEEITELYHEVQSMKTSEGWERVVSTGDLSTRRKKSSLKNYFIGGSKLQKTLKKGVYLATILYKDDKVLCTVDDTIPVVEVDDNPPSCFQSDFLWFMKLSCTWDDVKLANFVDYERIHHSPNLVFRWKLLEATLAMQSALGVQDLGRLHSKTITDSRGVTILVTVQHIQEPKTVQGLAVKWMPINKLFKRQTPPQNVEKDVGGMELLFNNLLNFLNFYESSNIPLDRGLYLGYVKLHSSMNQISLVVPENLPSVLPFVYIRSNPHVSKEEWNWLAALDNNQLDEITPTSSQISFHWALVSAAKMLLSDLEVNQDDIPFHRIYRLEVVEIHSDVSFILLVPGHSDVCTAPGQQKLMAEEKRGCLALPVPMFEVSHLCTYQPDFIALYCRMSVFLEFYTNVLQQLQRQTLNDDETKFYKQQLDLLNGYQQRLDELWKTIRWITSVVSAARDKHLKSGLPLSILFAYSSVIDVGRGGNGIDSDRDDNLAAPWAFRFRRASSEGSDVGEDNSDVGYHSDQSIDKTGLTDPSPKLLPKSTSRVVELSVDNPNYEPLYARRNRTSELTVPDNIKRVKIFRRQLAENSSASVDIPGSTNLTLVRQSKINSNAGRRRSGSFTNLLTNETSSTNLVSISSRLEVQNVFQDGPSCSTKTCDSRTVSEPLPIVKPPAGLLLLPNGARKNDKPSNCDSGVLRVYAAYPCGLTKGTSVKLHVTQKTTSKEVTALVVHQLNKSAKMKRFEGPFYDDDEMNEFCLVAVIGARERCLRDDYPPLDLQNPWSKGKLFVRRRHDLLAALEYGNEAKV